MQSMKRVGIFFFFDQKGIVDEYIEYLLAQMTKVIDRLVIVCNGEISQEGKALFSNFTKELIVRENKGLDAWAYKAGIDYLGWEEIEHYDELLMFNFTMFGPIYPIENVFKEMEKIDVDFWGIFKRLEDRTIQGYGGHRHQYGYIPEFITSNFWCIKNKMKNSEVFKKYWDELPPINSYFDSINLHETVFTKTMSEAGFTYTTLDHADELGKYAPSLTSQAAERLLGDYQVPFFRRRVFSSSYMEYINLFRGDDAVKVLEYVERNTNYDVNLIWDNVLRTTNQYDLKNRLCFNYVMSEEYVHKKREVTPRIAAMVDIRSLQTMEKYTRYLNCLPKTIHLYITTDDYIKKIEIQKKFASISSSRFEIVVIEKGDTALKTFLKQAKQLVELEKYDLICVLNDEDYREAKWEITNQSYQDQSLYNLVGTVDLVENIISKFEDNPRLGILSPQEPNYANTYDFTMGVWQKNIKDIKDIAKKINITVPIENNKPSVASYSGMFWVRATALKDIYIDEKHVKLLEEHISDGLIKRIIPLMIQQGGYYPAYVSSQKYATMQMNYQSYMLDQINNEIYQYTYSYSYNQMLQWIHNKLNQIHLLESKGLITKMQNKVLVKQLCKNILPKSVIKLLKKVKNLKVTKK